MKTKLLLMLLILPALLLTTSCKSNMVKVKNYSEEIDLLKRNFPEIYEQFRNGSVVIDGVYTYTDKNTGRDGVRVKYHRAPTYIHHFSWF